MFRQKEMINPDGGMIDNYQCTPQPTYVEQRDDRHVPPLAEPGVRLLLLGGGGAGGGEVAGQPPLVVVGEVVLLLDSSHNLSPGQ